MTARDGHDVLVEHHGTPERSALGDDDHAPVDGSRVVPGGSSADDNKMHEVLEHQRRLGAATGLLAHRFGCSTEQAWHLLVRLSQNSNLKVRVVAQVLVEAFDGRPRPEDSALRALVAAQLPPMDWPGFAEAGAKNDD